MIDSDMFVFMLQTQRDKHTQKWVKISTFGCKPNAINAPKVGKNIDFWLQTL